MATHVIYNGIEIHNCQTRQWDQRIVYEPSGADVEKHEFSMTFEGIIHADSLRDSDRTWVDTEGTTSRRAVFTPALYDYIQRRLSQPRETLEVFMTSGAIAGESGDTSRKTRVFLAKRAQGSTSAGISQNEDVDQGPKPLNVTLTQIVSDRLFRVRFVIQCSLIECVNASAGVPYVISNRWSVSESMDDNFYMTKTIRGRMKVSEPFSNPLSVKAFIIPRLEQGMRRVSVMMASSPNGLEAEYEITDRQTHTSAPWPATKISGSYTQSTGDGLLWDGHANIKLDGSPEANRLDLITTAVRAAEAKLNIENQVFGADYIMLNFTITENIGAANSVAVDIRVKHNFQEKENQADYLGRLRKNLGRPLKLDTVGGDAYDPTFSRVPAVYGYSPQAGLRSPSETLVLRCAMHDPCSPNKSYEPSYPPSPSEEAEEPTEVYSREEKLDSQETEHDDIYDSSHGKAIYTHYEVTSSYGLNPCRVQLPIANSTLPPTANSSAIATLCRPQATRDMVVSASRVGTWPEIPPPLAAYQDGSLVGVLLDHTLTPTAPRATVEGRQKVYEIEARYKYALNRPPTAAESIRVGINGYLSGTPESQDKLAAANVYNPRLGP